MAAKAVIIAIAVVLVLLVGAGITLYAMDFGIEATIQDKDCSITQGSSVEVETKLFSINKHVTLPFDQCSAIQSGNHVKYYLQSERVSIWESEGGACIWDTENGANGC